MVVVLYVKVCTSYKITLTKNQSHNMYVMAPWQCLVGKNQAQRYLRAVKNASNKLLQIL